MGLEVVISEKLKCFEAQIHTPIDSNTKATVVSLKRKKYLPMYLQRNFPEINFSEKKERKDNEHKPQHLSH